MQYGMETTNYVYQKEVDWSTLHEGFTLPVINQVVFARNVGRFLQPGEKKEIKVLINGKTYRAILTNVKFNQKHRAAHPKDVLQIRYTKNGELSQLLQQLFYQSYQYLKAERESAPLRKHVRLPENRRDYIAIYTTEYDDTYIFEPILAEDVQLMKTVVKDQPEEVLENAISYSAVDETSAIAKEPRLVNIRRLNQKIGENLKQLYSYRCQICGEVIGSEYDTHVIEAHHIIYFAKSQNNNSDNQIVVCPNHHRIIHSANPTFIKKDLLYLYPNGKEQHLILNYHL